MSVNYNGRPDNGDRGEKFGPGTVKGAGEQMMGGNGPGPASRKKTGLSADSSGTRPAASGKQPSGMTIYPEGKNRGSRKY